MAGRWTLLACVVFAGNVLSCQGRFKDAAESAGPDGRNGCIALTDFAQDGTPDFLRLDDEADQEAFAGWFTFLAEAQYFQAPGVMPKEIVDCAALIRFAYREALREHDGAWANSLRLPLTPALPSIEKYRYPHTPLAAGLFRVAPGPFRREDLGNGAFAEFADAKTLRLANTHLISRELVEARRGDLLFFEQAGQHLPFHAMIYLGASQLEPGPDAYLVYHTGPTGDDLGEIRRPSVSELLRHPQPEWRPVAGNANFLGVYRWNILRTSS
jgi:uncharacterized protein YfaT (DUF1175 family)